MRFRLYREYGALNSRPVFDAFSQGIKQLGHEEVKNNEDISVIWSVLWKGRMQKNKDVYDLAIRSSKPIIIIEVGNFIRGVTWRISLDNINGQGIFGNEENLDDSRPQKLGVLLKPIKNSRKEEILICGQLPESLQWQGMPSMEKWFRNTVDTVRQHCHRKIVVRPHPRSNLKLSIPGVRIEMPKKIPNTYDDYDIDYDYHCVINHNSGPAVQAAINGTPIISDRTSLAYPVSEKWENLENPCLPDRTEWFKKLCHTEWTVEEISQGIPLTRILSKII